MLQVPLGGCRRDSEHTPVAPVTGLKVSHRQLGAAGINAAGQSAEQTFIQLAVLLLAQAPAIRVPNLLKAGADQRSLH